MKKLVLIDGNSLMFRAYYATAYTGNLMKTTNGLYTNALYGFVNMFNKILSTEKPDYLFVAFDKGKKTRRHQVYSEYKGGRKPMPEEFRMQIPYIKKYLDLMNIKHYECLEYDLLREMEKFFTFSKTVFLLWPVLSYQCNSADLGRAMYSGLS